MNARLVRCALAVVVPFAGLVVPFVASAQYTADFQTVIISGVTSNWSGDYFVGSNTFANALLIRNGGVLTNADGHLGYMPASNSNSVIVAGAGSVWSNANVYLGDSGIANTLVISNAGRIVNSLGAYIANNATSSSNRVLVVGTNSVWVCADHLSLGVSGPGNSLVISNGGRVVDSYSEMANETTSSGNSAVVTGAGSVWSNTYSCTIGRSGSNNRMTVNKGGRLYSNFATAGFNDSAGNNSVLVSDSGSLWDDSAVASVMRFGFNGSGNSLVVSNGGQVLGYYAYFGDGYSSSNNSALVTGPGSSFSGNCYIYTGNMGHDNTFTVANGAAVAIKFCYISYGISGNHNSVLITGTNSSWQNSYSVFDGFDGAAGNLTVSNGASLQATEHGVLGYASFSHDNRAEVTGTGSVWNCTLDMFVGYDGRTNTLVINNGGRVISDYGFLGSNPGSDSNNVIVVGAGSVWTNSDDVYVGNYGAANSLVISNAGQVIDYNGWLGADTNSTNNNAVVTGTGSVWSNAASMGVGGDGSNNGLVISGSGQVIDGEGCVGCNSAGRNNHALVTGSGSVWNNGGWFYSGQYGAGNSVVITNGGRVLDYVGSVGYISVGASNNSVLVTGSGSVWSNGPQLVVGWSGPANSVTIRDGGTILSDTTFVGIDSSSSNNSLLVAGVGSVWKNANDLYIGYSGAANSLVISNGGRVVNDNGCLLGVDPESSNNVIRVTGIGSACENQNDFYIGFASPGNSLVVAGGTVLAPMLVVGEDSSTCDNLLQLDSGSVIVTNVTGTAVCEVRGGTLILNGGTLHVNKLVITNACARLTRNGGTLIYGSALLTPSLDADGDGMANGWEQAYGLDPLNAADASADNDGDGMSNLQESLAGTDPTNSASAFRITSVVRTDNDVLVTWATAGGHTNVVQAARDVSGSYSNVSPNIVLPGSGDVTANYLDAGGATNGTARFYRIRLLP